jgi:hypothetical protein
MGHPACKETLTTPNTDKKRLDWNKQGSTKHDYPVALLKIDRQREIFISSSFEDEISMTSSDLLDLLLGRGLW